MREIRLLAGVAIAVGLALGAGMADAKTVKRSATTNTHSAAVQPPGTSLQLSEPGAVPALTPAEQAQILPNCYLAIGGGSQYSAAQVAYCRSKMGDMFHQ